MITYSELLFASVLAAQGSFNSYLEMRDSGAYYSPGFDCEININDSESVFTATIEEDRWAIYLFKKVPLSVSSSGYEVKMLIEEQADGEGLECRSSFLGDADKSNDIVEIQRRYGGDPQSPDFVTFVIGRGPSGDFESVSCGWSFGQGKVFWKNKRLYVEYRQQDGEFLTIAAQGAKPCLELKSMGSESKDP